MSFHRDLVNKIKSNKRDEIYILLKQIIEHMNLNLNDNQYFLKEFKQNHADMLLSFLADEKDQKIIPNYFNILLELYTKNNWHLTLSSYSLVIRILCNLQRVNEALDYLNDVERHNLPIKTRLISPFFETLKSYKKSIITDYENKHQKYYGEINSHDDFYVSRNELLILVDLFDRYQKVITIDEINCLLLKFKEYINIYTILDTSERSNSPLNIYSIINEVINDILEIWVNNDQVIPRISFDLLMDIKNFTSLNNYTINECLFEEYITQHSSVGLICKKCNNSLKKHILEKDEKKSLKTQLINSHPNSQKVLNKFEKWILEYISKTSGDDILYILDGGNIGHSLYSEFSFKAILKIIELIKNKYRDRENKINTKLHVILILHKRHKEGLEKSMLLEDNVVSIYLTPPNHNDDLFWILSSLMMEKSFIISNDLMRDHHVNKLDETLFNRWKDTHMVKYDIHTNEFSYPTEYTSGIQKFTNGIHIPVLENDKIIWYCFSKA
jgi:pentatricopeptide repeat protein